jgi:hypothetical protein
MRLSCAVAGVVAAAAVGGALGPVATAAPAPAGTLIARIGWHYTSDLFTTSHSSDVTIH